MNDRIGDGTGGFKVEIRVNTEKVTKHYIYAHRVLRGTEYSELQTLVSKQAQLVCDSLWIAQPM